MKIGSLIKDVASSWSTDKVSTLAAALAYYTLFSLTPILLISLDIVGFFFKEELVRLAILAQIKELIGPDTSTQIQLMIENAYHKPTAGILRQLIGWILLIIGSSAVFSETQSGLNHIWGVTIDHNRGWFTIIRKHFLSFIMVLGVSLLLLFSFVLSVLFTAMNTYLSRFWDIGPIEVLIVNSAAFFIVFLLFSMIFKILPDVKIKWRNVWLGALITTVLFMIGKSILGIYLSSIPFTSTYGAAGSLIILLIWVYYSAQIFFIGAEITKVIAFQKHEKLTPRRQALIVDAPVIHPATTSKSRKSKQQDKGC